VSEDGRQGFVDTVGAAFLRRRLQSRQLRAAGVRGLKGVSGGAGGLQIEFDHGASSLAQVPRWLDAHSRELAAAPVRPSGASRVPRLSIVIMAVGSRGDVQPFIPIGQRLAQRHRVRLATHAEFRPMVEQAGLEFYPLAGDPHELMEYMVKPAGGSCRRVSTRSSKTCRKSAP